MKIIKIFIIIYLILTAIIIGFFLIKNNTTVLDNVFYEEPVIENKISIKAKEIHDYMRENNYGYCTYDNRCNHDGECGLNVTFEASKTGHHNTCCATYVSWVLQELGYLTKQEHIDNYLNGANNLIKYLTQKGWKEVDKNDIQPGDILCYNGHIAIYGGRGRQYDAGNRIFIQEVAPIKNNWKMNVEKILRAPDL
jgi:uncharacterized protein YxeA